MTLLLSLPIAPIAKGRPRFTKAGHCYTPDETRKYERQLAAIAREAYRGQPLTGPLKLSIVFCVPKPKRPKFKLPAVRPDLDNYVKAVKDALNGIYWVDDGQIVHINASKVYASVPMITLEISEVQSEPTTERTKP